MNRSKKAFKNVYTGIFNKILLMALSFATRTVFIKILGVEYVGVSSLYTNVLSVLSIAELGIGNVLMFYLYKELKNQDEKRIRLFVYEFKKIYRYIIIIIITFGVLLIPFIHIIVKSELNYSELVLYYIIYLINSIVSYFVAYRTLVLSADQKNYIINNVSTISTIFMYVFQLIYLVIFKNFIGYLLIMVLFTIINNVVCDIIVVKKYPYIKDKNDEKLSKNEKKELMKDITGTFMFKFSESILNQTDSIIISVLLGTIYVGLYSNYYILMTFMSNISSMIATGLVSSFGNLVAENNIKKSYLMFKSSLLLFSIFATVCVSIYICVVQDFILIWLGNDYIMQYDVIISIMMVFYVRMVTNTMWMYRSAMGLFKDVQWASMMSAFVNIVLSIVLGIYFGVAGVISSTAISIIVTRFWYEGIVIYKKFNKKASEYFIRQLRDFCLTIVVSVICVYLCKFVSYQSIALNMMIKIIICVSISSLFAIVLNFKSEEFINLKKIAINIIKK